MNIGKRYIWILPALAVLGTLEGCATARPGTEKRAYRGKRNCEVEWNPESVPKFGLESATRLHEVGIASNRKSECCGEYVPGPCTHRPSHHGSGLHQKWPA